MKNRFLVVLVAIYAISYFLNLYLILYVGRMSTTKQLKGDILIVAGTSPFGPLLEI